MRIRTWYRYPSLPIDGQPLSLSDVPLPALLDAWCTANGACLPSDLFLVSERWRAPHKNEVAEFFRFFGYMRTFSRSDFGFTPNIPLIASAAGLHPGCRRRIERWLHGEIKIPYNIWFALVEQACPGMMQRIDRESLAPLQAPPSAHKQDAEQ